MIPPPPTDRLHVITGGPGSGKSSLVAALLAHGIATMPEAGRAIIRDQVAIGGPALPWDDRAAFAELMLAWEMRSHAGAVAAGVPTILDRGIGDVIGYLTLNGLPVPDHMHRAAQAFRYNRIVLIAPHWPAIYIQDAERRQTAREAAATHDAIAAVYRSLDYVLVPLPLAPVAERLRFVLDRIGDPIGR